MDDITNASPPGQVSITLVRYRYYPFMVTDRRPWHARLWQAIICVPRYVVTGRFHIGAWEQ